MACREPVGVPGGNVRVIGRLPLVAALLLLAPSARAQGNYRSAALGGRSALMGDTGIALGTDGAAPFLNPATTVQVQSTLAVSISFLTLDVQHASDWYAPGADVTRVSGNAIPSTLCFFFRLPRLYTPSDKSSDGGRQKLAACFGNTEIQSFDWVGQGFRTAGTPGAIETTSVHWAWQRFVVGPSYAVNLTPALAVGASVLGNFTNYSSFASVSQTVAGSAASSVFEDGASGSDFGLGAAFGATLHLSRFTLGAMIQSPERLGLRPRQHEQLRVVVRRIERVLRSGRLPRARADTLRPGHRLRVAARKHRARRAARARRTERHRARHARHPP